MNKTISQDKSVDTYTTSGKHFKIASQPLLNIKTYFFPFWQTPISHVWTLYVDLESWADGTYQRMDPWHLINLLAQRQPLEGISNWPLKLFFLTLGQISFVLTMQNIIFPIFGRLIFFIWDHDKTTWRYGWIVSSPSNMTMLPNDQAT